MEILVVGLNHRTAPVEIRERLSDPPDSEKNLLEEILKIPNVIEGLYLSTCNRVELVLSTHPVDSGSLDIKKFLISFYKISSKDFEKFLYIYTSHQAIRHIFRVTSSLDSMIVGEPQILGQVKQAYQDASKKGALGLALNRLFETAFSVAKRIRTDTKIAENPVSISFAAVELAKKIFVGLEEKVVLLIGAGEMSELAIRHLISAGVHKIVIANRTFNRAQNLAEEFEGEAIVFENLLNYFDKADIIISSTGASDFIVKYETIRKVIKKRKNRPMFFIDIAVPRDIDPAINSLDNIYLYDIDDLQGVVDNNLEERQREVLEADKIIDEEVGKFVDKLKAAKVTPVILSLKEKLEEVGREELKKTMSRLGGIAQKEKKALESLTASIINKISHHPVTFLKRKGGSNYSQFYIDMVKELFHLDE